MSQGLSATLDADELRPTDLADVLPAGATVFLEQGAAEPLTLHRALLGLPPATELRLLAAPIAGVNDCDFANGAAVEQLNPLVFVSTPSLSGAIRRGVVDYVPLHWSEVICALRGRFRPDVVLLQVSPPDGDGYCNLGSNAAFELEVAHMAGLVIAEVNHNMPTVGGDTKLHQSRIGCFVESRTPLRALAPRAPGEVERQIARHVSRLIASGSTLQVGPGRIPDAIMEELQGAHKRVRFHSGILTDAMLRVALASEPGSDAHIVAGMLLGSEALYRDADGHPRIELRSTDYTHSQANLAALDCFVSINSAIEVDLLGQVNAESAGGRQIAGVGGQVDFVRGARAGHGGLSIIALPSTGKDGPRIVPSLAAGTPVSTSRVDVDVVVTEFGVAELGNRTVRERAEALVRIAHPDDRELLRAATRTDSVPDERSQGSAGPPHDPRSVGGR